MRVVIIFLRWGYLANHGPGTVYSHPVWPQHTTRPQCEPYRRITLGAVVVILSNHILSGAPHHPKWPFCVLPDHKLLLCYSGIGLKWPFTLKTRTSGPLWVQAWNASWNVALDGHPLYLSYISADVKVFWPSSQPPQVITLKCFHKPYLNLYSELTFTFSYSACIAIFSFLSKAYHCKTFFFLTQIYILTGGVQYLRVDGGGR